MILGLRPTTLWEFVQHHFRNACNTNLGVCATSFQKCVQHHFRRACNIILEVYETLGVRATSF